MWKSIYGFIFNRLYKAGDYTVRLLIYFLMFVHRYFFKECSDFDTFFVVVEKISASWWSHSKIFLNLQVVNLPVYLLNILFGYNFCKNYCFIASFFPSYLSAFKFSNCKFLLNYFNRKYLYSIYLSFVCRVVVHHDLEQILQVLMPLHVIYF